MKINTNRQNFSPSTHVIQKSNYNWKCTGIDTQQFSIWEIYAKFWVVIIITLNKNSRCYVVVCQNTGLCLGMCIRPPDIKCIIAIIFSLFLNQNICCGYARKRRFFWAPKTNVHIDVYTYVLFVKIDPRHMNIQWPFTQSSWIFVTSAR